MRSPQNSSAGPAGSFVSRALLAAAPLVACLALAPLLLLCWARPAQAGPSEVAALGANQPQGQEARPTPSALENAARSERERVLDWCLPIQLPRQPEDLLCQVTLARRIPGSQIVRYRGLQGFLVRRLRRAYDARWRRSLRDMERAGGLDHFELAARYRVMAEARADLASGGRWWERSWLDSLPAEKGGAPVEAYVEEVGSQIDVFQLGPLSISNDFRARFDGGVFGLGLSSSSGRVFRDLAEGDAARDYASYARFAGDELDEALPDQRGIDRPDEDDDEDEVADPRPGRPTLSTSDLFDLALEARAAAADSEVGPCWRFRVRPEARVRLRPGSPTRARVGLRAVFELSLGPPRARQRVLDVVARVRYDLQSRELTATLQLQLVAW